MATKKRGRQLVIVESPAKARTVASILGSQYDVRASIGHVRDLPKSRLGVDIDGGFEPTYIVPKEKREVVKRLKEVAKNAAAVYLATDPDREGEAISWHLVKAIDLERLPHHRVVFHEITKDAIQEAFRHPREIDMQLVSAQQARRVLDRLVGYTISPLLWKKVRRGLSAGRVQSVAVRMVVDREREIERFVPQEYWTIDADLKKDGTSDEERFRAKLIGLVGKKKDLEIPNREAAERLVSILREAQYRVLEVRQRVQHRRPPAPFTTSTLQQEASRRLGFTAKRTMTVAQQLYEGLDVPGEGQVGLITYMRTDSTNLAEAAVRETRHYIAEKFGRAFLPAHPRIYKTKTKGAQEAHEAIRPTSIRREPGALRRFLTGDQFKLYALIWERMVACQMADAVYDVTAVEIEAAPATGGEHYQFRATYSVLRFPGYRHLYIEASDEVEEENRRALPPLAAGDPLTLLELYPEQHFTQPPPRYTEATLVKALEENGIGRPSTYAPILSTIQQRGYVEKDGRVLKPTELGFIVNDLLVTFFPDYVDLNFTAEMEEELDEIASGDRAWQPVVREFFAPLQVRLKEAEREAPRAEEETEETCEKCGRPMLLKWGRFGRFLACSGYPECKSTRPVADADENAPQPDESCPECRAPMIIKNGRFGKFLACSRYPECKTTKSIPLGVTCPQCGGDVVARRSRRGRAFYGCANYPECNFSTWNQPLKAPCPNCGGLIVISGRANARCLQCGWKGSQSDVSQELIAV